MSAPAAVTATAGAVAARAGWAELVVAAPRLAATAARYLDQIGLSLRPGQRDHR